MPTGTDPDRSAAGDTAASVESSRSAPRRIRIEARRDPTLAAAASSMAACGYERVTLEQIGEAVGLSPTGLYHYVGGREDILAQLMIDSAEAVARDAEALSGGGRGPTVRDHPGSLAGLADHRGGPGAQPPPGYRGQRQLPRHVVGARREHDRRVEEIVAADPRSTARFVLGALNGVPGWCPDGVAEGEVNRIADQFVEHVVAGIGAPARQARGGGSPLGADSPTSDTGSTTR